ncbi:hypothetical protein F8M41_013439 [Gigaspora margarita]|uniref:Uncharacterized protein n=1 Tax=Gigaspora margarita TaxID=4874 RepID=A0A8H3WZX3_GIGMA|nr:hypothetical protein F8M41_013439 [Gigaspora margarita]
MLPLSKGKRKAKNQVRDDKGWYSAKKKDLTDQEDMVNEFSELYNSDTEGELDINNEHGGKKEGSWNKYNNELDVSDLEWGDEDDSRWDNMESEIKELNLEWKNDSQFEKTKRGPYMKGKTPKSTYYNKYGPNGIFTKAAVGTKKITSFFTSPQLSDQNDLEEIEISDDSDSEPDSYALMINKKANDLKKELEQNHK